MRVSHCIRVLMERLSKTNSWVVALKCLNLIQTCLYDGGFMFQDQFSVYPVNGGRNYLNLSNFRDASSPSTWAISVRIRWRARFIEQWIQTGRLIRCFLDARKDRSSKRIEKCLSVSNRKLLRDINALHDLLVLAASLETEESFEMHVLEKEGMRIIVAVIFSACEEIKFRLHEAQARVATLQTSEALVLSAVCEKLSKQSMVFRFLLELVRGELLQDECSSFEQILFSNDNLMDLKRSFQLACSSVRVSPSSEQSALPWYSSGTTSDEMKVRKNRSISAFASSRSYISR
ncbi:hypothetical protein KP509_20G087800 [Ceratopteris richardii]|nr:hypothetical protein KP509_20G087800 [Ceratopteris richardii]